MARGETNTCVWQQRVDGSLERFSGNSGIESSRNVDIIHGSYEFVLPSLLSLSQIRSREFSGIASLLLDAGVSSHQLDSPYKGFSYKHNQNGASLDMRFAAPLPPSLAGSERLPASTPSTLTAHELVNTWGLPRIAEVLQVFGDMPPWLAESMAAAILDARRVGTIDTAPDLARVLAGAASSNQEKQGFTYTMNTFSLARAVGPAMAAIRIAVNSELDVLRRTLAVIPHLLLPGGVAAVLTFQPAERLAVQTTWRPLLRSRQLKWLPGLGGKRGLRPTPTEVAANPRAKPTTLFAVQRST